MLKELRKDMEIIFCINANDIERNKMRAEFDITYDVEVLRLIDNLRGLGFTINSVVITLYNNQSSVDNFRNKLDRHGIRTYIHRFTKGYPLDIDTIVLSKNTVDLYNDKVIRSTQGMHFSKNIIFAVGGDGTLNEVVRGNLMRAKKMTICPLPSGTCNDVATMLGYGSDPHKNMELVLDGVEHSMDIGTINDTPFVYVVGMGKFMNIPYERKSSDKRRAGYLAYVKDGVKEALDKLKRYKTEVEIDGNKMDGYYSLIMISNSDHVAGVSRFHKNVCLDDGELEVLLCKAQTKTKFIKNFLQLFLGRNTDEIISLKARDIKIKLIDKPSKKWCIDGEKYEYNGDTFHIKANKKSTKSDNKVLFCASYTTNY